jgi:hypothetical protein
MSDHGQAQALGSLWPEGESPASLPFGGKAVSSSHLAAK